jgi:membrane protease YdiL (CAAX protease family)
MFLWYHLSLLVIIACWAVSALHRLSPRDSADWTLGHLFWFALLGTVVTWIVVWLLLKHDGEKVSELGFRKEQIKWSFLFGIPFGIGIFFICNVVLPRLTWRWFAGSEAAPVGNWFHSPWAVPAWIFLGWIAGGLTEELRRAFVLTRFEKVFGRAGLIAAVLVSSIMFGVGHLYQGKAAAYYVGISGLLYALVYLRRRSCWEAAVAHATFDSIGITILLWTNLGRGG